MAAQGLGERFPGLHIPPDLLDHSPEGRLFGYLQDNLDAAVELLAGTRYEPALRDGLQAYKQSSRLSEFEIHLRRFRLSWLSKWIFKDPLGIGVFLGYLALKITEINNLRWITHGIQLGLGTSEIKAGLEYAS